MKNIYQDDSYNPGAEDIFSKTVADPYAEGPQRPKTNIGADFTDDVQVPSTPAQNHVRSARQAPPPIRRSAPAANFNQPPAPQGGAYYGTDPAYAQQPYYPPQPVYYQGNPPQAYPVYGVPGQPYPVYTQGMPYPPQGYVQPVAQYPQQPPISQAPSAAYPPPSTYPASQQPVAPPAPATDPLSREAGTRVLYQSPDFDKKDETSDSDKYETLPHSYSSSPLFDVTEEELPSKKRAGKPTKPAFVIDEMEIGTYELGAMSLNRHAKTAGVQAPGTQNETAAPVSPLEENIEDTSPSEEEYQYAIPDDANAFSEHSNIIPDDIDEETAPEEADEKKEKKKLSASEKIRRIILVIAGIAIVVSAYMLFNEYRLHKENEKAMSDISSLIITEPVTEPSTTEPSTTEAATENGNNAQTTTKKPTTTKPVTTRYLTPSEQFALLKQQNPDIVFPENMQPKYAKLYVENQDFVGYLHADNSDLDFPIVQGKDNDEYIEINFFGEYTKYGSPFMEATNNTKNLDMNTVIYGHNMRDGSLFAALEQYMTLEGYKEAPVISFNTLYQDFDFKVIAVMITNINPEDDNGYVFRYYWTNLNSVINYKAYLNQLAQRSFYDTGVDVQPSDRILTLSTCHDEFDDARLVVVARLVRPGESSAVDTSKAVENPNPRFPQAYYDEHGMTNPYKNAFKWEPS